MNQKPIAHVPSGISAGGNPPSTETLPMRTLIAAVVVCKGSQLAEAWQQVRDAN